MAIAKARQSKRRAWRAPHEAVLSCRPMTLPRSPLLASSSCASDRKRERRESSVKGIAELPVR
jgi:hypothetical protein